MNWLAASVLVSVMSLSACNEPFPPVAVIGERGHLTALFKFCDAARGIGSLRLARVEGGDDPDAWPVVWTATARTGQDALQRLPLRERVAGYDVEVTDEWPLDPDHEYAVVSASDGDGVNLLFSPETFKLAEAPTPVLVSQSERGMALDAWLGPAGPECH